MPKMKKLNVATLTEHFCTCLVGFSQIADNVFYIEGRQLYLVKFELLCKTIRLNITQRHLAAFDIVRLNLATLSTFVFTLHLNTHCLNRSFLPDESGQEFRLF